MGFAKSKSSSASRRPVATPASHPVAHQAPTHSATRSYQPSAAPAPARPMASSAPAPARPAAAAPAAAAAPHAQQSTMQPAPMHSGVPAQAPSMGGGGGMLQGIATIAAGSVIGHGISHMLFDKSSSDSAPAPAPAQASVAPAQSAAPQSQEQQDPCFWPARDFQSCLSQRGGDIGMCQGLFDSLQECRRRGVTSNYY